MDNLPKEVLVIDDDSTVGQSVLGPISSYKVNISNTQDRDTAIYQFNNQDFPVVMVELEYEALNGLVLIQKLRNHDSPEKRATGFIIMSGKTRKLADENLLKELCDLEVIVKPFSVVHLLPYLSRAFAFQKKQLVFEKFRQDVKALADAKKHTQAIEDVKKKVGQFGQKGILLLCDLYEMSGGFQDALNFITPFTQKDPTNMQYAYTRARLLMLLGKHQEAKPILEKCNEFAPNHLGRLGDMSELYLGMKMPEKAVASMKTLLTLTPENQDIKFAMFKRLDDCGYGEHAQKFCRDTTKPSDVVRYYNNKGVELSRNGDIEGAIREYERAIKFFPDSKDNYRIYYNIALAQIKFKTRESYQSAGINLEKCLALSPAFDKAKATLESINKMLQKKAG